jgi:hypothetical protein
MTKQNEKYLFYAVGAIAAYFFVLKPILKKLGLEKSETEKESETAINKYLTNEIAKGSETKTPGEWAIIANQIYDDLRYSAISDKKSDATYQIARAKNSTDVALLIKSFGKRREYLFGIPAGAEMDLQQFVKSNLSNTQIASINDNYKRKGIKYQF